MTKPNYTSINIILDASGSMHHLTDQTIKSFNDFLKEQKEVPGEASLSLAVFNHEYNLVHDFIPLQDVPNLSRENYKAEGSTALLDAIGRTVNATGAKLAALKEEERPNKIVVLILTDGQENCSTEFNHKKIAEMVKHQEEKYSWKFIFIGANMDVIAAGGSLGINKTATYSFNATQGGTQAVYSSMSAGLRSYRTSSSTADFNMVNPTDLDQDANKKASD